MGKENLLEVDPDGLVSLEFLRPDKTILLGYENFVSIFDSFLEIGDDFTIEDETLGGEKYCYRLDNYRINKMWPVQ
ncbi:unnamed protein product, partial [marine sediment metagenome]